MKYIPGERGIDYRVAIMNSDGKYLAEDRHSDDGLYWTTFDDCFMLRFDTPEQAKVVACKYDNVVLQTFDMEDHLEAMFSKKEQMERFEQMTISYMLHQTYEMLSETREDNQLFKDYKDIDKFNLNMD